MIHHYEIVDTFGIPGTEVRGDDFHPLDLYEMIGREQFMTTFQFKQGSDAAKKYGRNITGVVFYDFKTKTNLEEALRSRANIVTRELKIDTPFSTLGAEEKKRLKYQGVHLCDLESIAYLRYRKEIEFHNTGEKKIPNIIEIKADLSGIDPIVLSQNYLVSKANSGVELIQFEKEELIGLTLGMNDFRIDSRVLEHFGFSKDSLMRNSNIFLNAYRAKEQRKKLTEEEARLCAEIKSVKALESIAVLVKEIEKIGLSATDLKSNEESLKKITKSAIKFKPGILLHGKKQIYWDLESYLHITLRHVKEFQINPSNRKTLFPYQASDLKSLIEKVLQRIEDEIKLHLNNQSSSVFVRHGSMAIEFNGDHFHLRIESSGRLSQFHTVSPNA